MRGTVCEERPLAGWERLAQGFVLDLMTAGAFWELLTVHPAGVWSGGRWGGEQLTNPSLHCVVREHYLRFSSERFC